MLRYVRFLLRFSRPLLLLLVLSVVLLGYFASKVDFDFSLEALFQGDAQEVRDFEAFARQFGSDDNFVYLAFKTQDVFADDANRALVGLEGRLRGIRGVQRVFSVADLYNHPVLAMMIPAEQRRRRILESPLFRDVLVSADGRAAAVVVEIDPALRRDADRAPTLAELREAAADVERDMGWQVRLAGLPVIEAEYVRLIRRDLLTFMPISLAVFFLLLALYFRSALGIFLPLLSILVADLWTVGLMQIAGYSIGVLTSIVPNLILVIGISDAIHVLSRHQEDLAEVRDKRDALATTILIMTGVCFLTTFTSAIGFWSLVVTDLPIIREFGLVTGVGLMLAYVSVMTLVTSVLDNAPPLRARVAEAYAQKWSDAVMNAIAWTNDRRRWAVLAGIVVVCVAAVAGMARVRSWASWLQDIRSGSPVREAHEWIDHNLSGVFTIELHVKGNVRDPEVLRAIGDLETFCRTQRGVGVIGPIEYLEEMQRWMGREPRLPESPEELDRQLQAVQRLPGADAMIRRVVDAEFTQTRITLRRRDLDSRDLERIVEAVMAYHRAHTASRFDLVPTGKSWMAKRALDAVVRNMMSSSVLAAVCIFTMMGLMFRSWQVGVLSIVPNVIPLFVTAGLMGWLGIPLNFSTMTVFSISLGLAVDNTIHYLARYRIEIAKDGDHVQAMYRTLKGAGRPMIFTSVLLVLGFGSILASNFEFTFNFGLLGGATVITALLADLFLTPTLVLIAKPRVRRWEGVEAKLARLDELIRRKVKIEG